MTHVTLYQIDEVNRKDWDAYVQNSSGSGYGHLSSWKEVIEESYGQTGYYLCAKENGVIRGVLPLIYMRSLCFGNMLVSLPFLDEAGICADTEMIESQLCRAAIELANKLGGTTLELRHRKPNSLPMQSFGDKVAMILELPDSTEVLWKALNAKVRNQVRKAMKSGLTIEWLGKEGLSEFYKVFTINMRDLASPVHSKKFFESTFSHFPDETRILVVKQGLETIAAGISFTFQHTSFMPWASSRREFISLCPNILLYWEAIQWSCDQGFKQFDFGRSSLGGGTYKFKKQWGALGSPLHWQHTGSLTHSATLNKEDAKFRWGMEVWRKLPLSITNTIGPWLRRQMSN